MACTNATFEEVLRVNNCFWNLFFSDIRIAQRMASAENVGDDLGLSGPVVAAFESYWPAKSQVVFDVNAKKLVSLRKKLSSDNFPKS